MHTILVTGATGFLGSNLADLLVREGYDVRILRRPSSDLRALGSIPVQHCIGDVLDTDSLRKAMGGCDTVFHAAAMISYWRKERPAMMQVNVEGTRNVVEACLATGIRRLVHTSSTAAIGFPVSGLEADEGTEFNWGPYDVGYRNSKHAAEEEILRGVRHGLDAVIVNPSAVIGPRDIHFHAGQLLRDVRARRIFYYVDGGMSIAFAADVVRGHLLAAQYGRTGERYILSGENLTHREVITTIADIVGGIRPLFRMPSPMVSIVAQSAEALAGMIGRRPWVSRELLAGSHLLYHFNCLKARRELGYEFIPFREAVQRTFAWYRNEGLLSSATAHDQFASSTDESIPDV